jgi:hypothetical protein
MKKEDTILIKSMINDSLKEIKLEKKELNKKKKLEIKKSKEKKILSFHRFEKEKNLKNLKKVNVNSEEISTCVDNWEEYIIKTPLISKESVMILLPFLQQEISDINKIIYSNNYLIRLYFLNEEKNIELDNIALHVEDGSIKILYFSNKSNLEMIKKIMDFFKIHINNSVELIKNETKKDRENFLKEVMNMKINFINE